MAFRTNKMPVLQEKSASGAVASFNTALAMPLVECKTEFMCTQEAGTPSPSNPLAITGVDKVAIQHGGKNLFNIANSINDAFLSDEGNIISSPNWHISDYQIVKPNTTYHFKPNSTSGASAKHGYYDENKNFIGYISSGEQTFTTPNNAYYMRFSYRDTSTDIILNFGSTAEDYEPYISNTVTLIDLDGTRYGGYVANDKLVLTHRGFIITENINVVLMSTQSGNQTFYFGVGNAVANTAISNLFSRNITSNDEGYMVHTVSQIYGIIDTSRLNPVSSAGMKQWLIDNNAVFVYQYGTPIEIALSDIPTLSTIIGNNSFASDSGSIDLTFKDLDIAKRGNFREVFKLPS